MTSPDEQERSKNLEELQQEATMVADHHRSGYYSRDAALADLSRRCPGFTQGEYEAAFARGLKNTR